MNNEYIIVNKTKVLEEIEELKASLNYIPESYIPKHLAQIYAYEQVLLRSTPLIPEIENAYDKGSHNHHSQYTEEYDNLKQKDISNLKLDI